ncbi:M23 family metallopeptidase [Novosphingobium sp. JCM 18896]|uniref:M23 family metallopeptidase n=1 Tax=Novosphingobium sp. JCM 18896 TaxID=2989731 RepID=UPI002222BE4C|nr:M23 family metallopeptidase [Novosphingobium sp. JCM 18896]MCW1429462.1 M23 family metallopeptidase [Novosphingobium sp. JCM 18896]
MVANGLFATVRAVAGSLFAAAAVFSASPVLANSSANADIAAPLRAAQAAKPATGGSEEQFKQLFSNWQAIEKQQAPQSVNLAASSRVAPVATIGGANPFRGTAVSIPSRIPVEGVHFSSDYGMRVHPVLGGRRAHKGVDLAAPIGTPIYATADGTVSRADWFSSYGLYVAIEHGGELQTRYGHMSRLNVAAGQTVRKGDVIGYVGTTGRSTGPHLHYEVRVAGQAVNPVPYMQISQIR